MPEKFFEFFVFHLLHQSGIVRRHFFFVVWNHCFCSCNFHCSPKSDVCHTGSYHDLPCATLYFPAVCFHIPVTERFIVKWYSDGLAFACFQEYFFKSFQFFCRTEYFPIFHSNIELRHFRSITGTGVGQCKCNAVFISMNICVLECGIRKPISKRILHADFACVIITIPHINAFPVFGISLITWKITESRCIFVFDWIGFCKSSGWIDFSGKNIEHGTGTSLSA